MESPEHVEHMQQFLSKICDSDKSVLIGPERYRKIVDVLLGAKTPDHYFKFWMKNKDFQLIDIPNTNEKNVLVAPGKPGPNGEDVGYVRVLKCEDIYPALFNIHVNEQSHGGYKKCIDAVNKLYYKIPRSCIQQFVKTCPTCQSKKRFESNLPVTSEKPVHEGVLEKIKINTIDMHTVSTAGYTHVGMVEDQYSKFIVLFPLKTNSPADVAQSFNHNFLGIFGPPKAFISDNGHEFMDQVLHQLLHMWNGIPLTLINETSSTLSPEYGSDRYSIIVDTLTTLISERGDNSCAWHDWLPDIALRLNTTQNEFKRSPYRMMFGHNARSGEYESNVIIKSVNIDEGQHEQYEKRTDLNVCTDDIIDSACNTAFATEETCNDSVESSDAILASVGLERRSLKRKNEQAIPKSSGESSSIKLAKSLLPVVKNIKKKKKKIKKQKEFSLAGCEDDVVIKATTSGVMKSLDRSKLGIIESSSPDIRRTKTKSSKRGLVESDGNSSKTAWMESDDDSTSSDNSSEEEDTDVLSFLTKDVGEKTKMEILKTIVTSLVVAQNDKKAKKKKGKVKASK